MPVLQLKNICSDSVSCKFDYKFKLLLRHNICDRACKNRPCERKKIADF